jgi:AcrR family transcriptional regulator
MGEESVRDQKRRETRRHVAETALGLFLQAGFERVTTTEIARAAGVSPRTFFRYFPTKEDAAIAALEPQQAAVVEALRARPDGEPLWRSLRSAFGALDDGLGMASLDAARLFARTPALVAARTRKQADWQRVLLPVVSARMGAADAGTRADLVAQALIASALACLDAATQAWAETDGTDDPAAFLDTAFAAVPRADAPVVGLAVDDVRAGSPASERP